MEEKNKPSATDSGEQSVSSSEGGEDVSKEGLEPSVATAQPDREAEVLKKLSETTKREYKDVDDAVKHVSELNKMSGDQEIIKLRKKAEKLDELEAAYKEETGDTLIEEEPEEENEDLAQKVELLEFFADDDNAQFKPYKSKIKGLMDKGLTLDEAKETVSELVEAKTSLAKKEEGTSVIETNKRVTADSSSRLKKMAKQALESNMDEDKEALVKEHLKAMGEDV